MLSLEDAVGSVGLEHCLGIGAVQRNLIVLQDRRHSAFVSIYERSLARATRGVYRFERAPKESTKGECVAPVGDRAGQSDQILNFLTAEEALAGL
jgi:hypothetical protein